jgi:hypothetical protein
MTNELAKPKTRKKRRPYPPCYRRAQAERIRATRPWEHATGPRTDAGKKTASLNATTHGLRTAQTVELRRLLALQRRFLKGILGGSFARQGGQNMVI